MKFSTDLLMKYHLHNYSISVIVNILYQNKLIRSIIKFSTDLLMKHHLHNYSIDVIVNTYYMRIY